MSIFTPATRRKSKARIALDGPSGSGKTWTALTIAGALGDRIAVIDTERGSASLYAGDFTFDVLEINDFSPNNLTKSLQAAAVEGYDVVIVDSLSLFWSGTNGMLEQVDNLSKRSSGGNFSGWKEARPMERRMIDAILAYPGHVIVTMRTKTEWVIDQNDRGRMAPKKVGTKAEQRDGIEYEFTVVGDLDLEHTMVVSKSRCSALAGAVIHKPDAEVGKIIREWIEIGESELEPQSEIDAILAKVNDPETTFAQFKALYLQAELGGLLGSSCTGPKGHPTTLKSLILDNGKMAEAREAQA